MVPNDILSRRDVLRSYGACIVSFSLGAAVPKKTFAQAGSDSDLGKSLDPHAVDSFLEIHPDGSVTVYTGKVDIGTGLRIVIRQMAAEELGVPVERIELVEGDTSLTPDQGGTGGSTGTTRGGGQIRQAAATARQAFLNLAAEQLHRPASELVLLNGEVRPVAGGEGIGVGSLIGGRRLSLKVDLKAPLHDPAQLTVIGKSIPRPDVPAKCTGSHIYVQDFSLPGMLHGRVIRPPSIGSKLLSVDESSIRSIPGVRVVRIENFLGVVGPDEWAAIRAARELKAEWSPWDGLPGNEGLEQFIRNGAIEKEEVIVDRGDADAGFASAVKTLTSTYSWPNQSHASLGPSCSVADMRPDGLTVWTSSQGTHGLRMSFAKLFGIAPEKVRVIYLDGAGSYGGNGNDDCAADAVVLSRAVGRPVRIQWMRHDEHGWDPKGPQQYLDLRGGLDSDGRICAWETHMWVPASRPGNRPLLALTFAGIPQPDGQNSGLLTQNADPPYQAANVKVMASMVKATPLRPSNLRAPGKIGNVFAVESFTDQMAAAAGSDPLEFRLRGLTDPRALDVLKRIGEMIDWQHRLSPNPHATQGNLMIGRGMAYVHYKQAENYVAMAIEIAVDRTTGQIHVHRVACAHDCGLIINPNALKNQVEGNILQTLSRTLHEEVLFDRSRVTSVDWNSYPILRMTEAPIVEVALLNRPNEPILGGGEAASAPVAAALANAFFDATGKRLYAVPFTPKRVLAALA